MSKKEKFLWAVQTGCLVRAFKENWDMGLPVRIVAAACGIPEEAIPDDIDGAAYTFLTWQFKYGCLEEESRPPDWLAPYIDGNAEDTEYWKL